MALDIEQEKKETLEALKQFKKDLIEGKQQILDNVRLDSDNVRSIVQDALPKNHAEQHIEIQRFLEHSPDPKMHGDHHDFTESVRSKLEHMIVAIFKTLGGIIFIALAIGFYTWVKHQASIL